MAVNGRVQPLDTLARNYEELWLALLVEGQTLGLISRSIDRKLSVLAILGMCNAVARWSRTSVDLGLEAVAASFTQLILSGLFVQKPETGKPDLKLVQSN